MGKISTINDLKVMIEMIIKSNFPVKLIKKCNNTVEIDNNKYHVIFSHLKVSNTCDNVSFRVVLRKQNSSGMYIRTLVGEFTVHILELEEKIFDIITHLYDFNYLGNSVNNLGIDIDSELEKIAQTVLEIPTLRTRKLDEYDFHEVSVWSLKESLKRAFDLGVDVGYKLGKRS